MRLQRLALSMFAICSALLGCERQETTIVPDAAAVAGAPTAVTLQLNWKPEPQFGGFYAAQRDGLYTKHNLDVTIQPGGASVPTVDMLGAGRVQFAIVSGDEIVRARANGNNIVGLFAVYQTNPQGVMTRLSRGFNDIGDVFRTPGTLAMEKGLPYSEFLKNKYGFDKLTLVPSPFGDLSLYRTKEDYAMQCFVTSEPLAARKTGIEPKTFLIADAGYNPYTTVLATTNKFAAEQPQVVADMVQAVRAGWVNYLADPTSANQVMGELNPTMDTQTLVDSAAAQVSLIETDETRTHGLGWMTLARWQTLVQQLTELKAIATPVDPATCFIAGSELQPQASR
jgi:NitT/TauT family transport system substrate-binding protein